MASPGMQDVSHALILYTERHFKRMDRHLQSAFVLDYLLRGMHVYEADAGEAVTESIESWRVPDERYTAGIAALAQPHAKASSAELKNGLDGDDWDVECALEGMGKADDGLNGQDDQDQAKECPLDEGCGGGLGHPEYLSGRIPQKARTAGAREARTAEAVQGALVLLEGRHGQSGVSLSSKPKRKSKQRAALNDGSQGHLNGAQDLGKEIGRENGAVDMHVAQVDGQHRAKNDPASRKAGDFAAAVQGERDDGDEDEPVGQGVLAPRAGHVALKRQKRSRSADGLKNGGGTKRRAGRRKST
jgi:hypothetical protein